jgi:hypothetical protein
VPTGPPLLYLRCRPDYLSKWGDYYKAPSGAFTFFDMGRVAVFVDARYIFAQG